MTIHNPSVMRERLSSDTMAAYLALDSLFEMQTPYERRQGATVIKNGFGFTQEDAPVLTKLAKVARRRDLTPREYETCFRLLPKYSKQVCELWAMGL